MTTGVLDRLPLEEITAQARDVQPGRTLVKLVVAPFYLAGRFAGRCSIALRMAVAAVKIGWAEVRAEAGIEPRKPAGNTGRA